MAFLYSETTGKTQQQVQDIEGAFVLVAAELVFTTTYSIINIYPSQMPILRRETNNHIYKFSAYYLSELICTFPIAIIRTFVGVAVFWIGFQQSISLYFQLSITLFLSSIAANAYGLMISGIFENVITEISSVFDSVFLVLSGLYINLNAFPYLRYISLFFYTNEALSIQFWHNFTEIGMHFNRFFSNV